MEREPCLLAQLSLDPNQTSVVHIKSMYNNADSSAYFSETNQKSEVHHLISFELIDFFSFFISISVSVLSDKSISVISNPPKSNPRPLYAPTSQFSQVTQEIMEICNVDQTGCEDPDVDTDTAAYILHNLEQELRVVAKGTTTTTPCTHSNIGGIYKF